MSPADELRKAAQHIRDVAGKAQPGPWWHEYPGSYIVHGTEQTVAEAVYIAADGAHIALWDPPTALLVAAVIEDEAAEMDRMAKESVYGPGAVSFVYEAGEVAPILKLARAINASAPSSPSTPEAKP